MSKGQQLRQHIAQEAARIMAEEGVSDFFAAKRKAAQRLGLHEQHAMPKNSEVQAALEEYQRLFLQESQPQQVQKLRQAAVHAMEFLHAFSPKLVGSVLSGNAGEHSDVNLHLFADCAEDVDHFLMDHRIPFQRTQKRLRMNRIREEISQFPAYRFVAGDVELELVVFPCDLRQAPRSPVDGRAMKRADITAVKSMLEQNASHPPAGGDTGAV